MTTKYFLSRMRRGRLRQLIISGCSVATAALFISFMSPSEVGIFAYYAITILLVINATLALMQFQQVIRPVEKILSHLNDISVRLEYNDLERAVKMNADANDVFGCLAAGIDDVMESMIERIEALQGDAKSINELLTAMPVALLIVTRDGKVAKILNAQGMGDSLQGFRMGEAPLKEYWGAENMKKWRDLFDNSMRSSETLWSDFTVKGRSGRGNETYRLSLRRINEMSMLMTILNMAGAKLKSYAGTNTSCTSTQKRAALRLMAASVAHDAKNVFAALNNLVTINRTSTDPMVREQIPIVEDAIRRGTALMSELTDIAGETRYHLKCVPAAEGFTATLENPTVKALFPENMKLYPWISEKPMPEVDLDLDQIWKIPLNLFKNAVEAMGEAGGSIWVKVEPFAMNEEIARTFRHSGKLQLGTGVLVTVTDDGPGMSEDVLDRIFDPYFSNKGDGRGLGLSTVMAIIDAHGGALNVKSSLGKGTSFYIYFPSSRNSSAELELMKEVAPNGEILLIDDDPTILHTTSLVLRMLKIAAHPAATEADAISKLRSLHSRIKAIITDANLSCTSSAGLVRRIREDYPGIPIIVSSGAPEDTIRSQFGGTEFEGFLGKPYSVEELSNAINTVTTKA